MFRAEQQTDTGPVFRGRSAVNGQTSSPAALELLEPLLQTVSSRFHFSFSAWT